METVENVKAASDYYGDVHLRRAGREETLCGLKVNGSAVTLEATCERCRRFARGEF